MRKDRPGADWPDFTSSARLQFWALPPVIIDAFADAFPEFTRFPQRPSDVLDVCPVRNDPARWRLKVAGYRAFYQIRQGRPLIEAILREPNGPMWSSRADVEGLPRSDTPRNRALTRRDHPIKSADLGPSGPTL